MAKDIPFDDDAMTFLMGVNASDEPGQHGPRKVAPPDNDAIELVTQIRDLCEDFLHSAGKDQPDEEGGEEEEEEPKKGKGKDKGGDKDFFSKSRAKGVNVDGEEEGEDGGPRGRHSKF